MARDYGSEPVFVFGSNTSGVHGAGAARYARLNYSAQLGVGRGRTGHSYALPTKGAAPQLPTLPLPEVQENVAEFIEYALANPQLEFRVTAVGCGLAGFQNPQIAPLFELAPTNCLMPPEWTSFDELNAHKFWRYEDYPL